MAIPDPINRISDPLSGILFNESPYAISASASLTIESDLSVSILRITFSSSTLDGELDVSSSGTIIKLVSANLDGIANITIVAPVKTIITGAIPLTISSNILIADLIRFTPSSRYPGSLVPLLVLDNHALTDQGRKFSDTIKQVFVQKSNWNGSKSRYYKRDNAGKQTFKISWEWLPSNRESTVDKREARDYIKKLAMDPDVHTLKVVTYGADPEDIFAETAYNVFITSYSEDLIRRDMTSDVYFWKCDLELEEV
jgi:hypothetical protein